MKHFRDFRCYSPEGEGGAGDGQVIEATPSAEPVVEPIAEPIAEPEAAPAAQSGLVARVGKLTREKRELEERLANYERQAAPQVPVDPASIDPETARRTIDLEINRRAKLMAEQESWQRTADRVWNDGIGQYPDWAVQINTMASLLGEIPRSLTEAAIETGAPTDVLYHLAKNPDLAAQVATMTPAKQGVALAKIASEAKGQGGKRVSAAPPPVTPKVSGGGAPPAVNLDDPNLPMEEWLKLRNAQIKARGRR